MVISYKIYVTSLRRVLKNSYEVITSVMDCLSYNYASLRLYRLRNEHYFNNNIKPTVDSAVVVSDVETPFKIVSLHVVTHLVYGYATIVMMKKAPLIHFVIL